MGIINGIGAQRWLSRMGLKSARRELTLVLIGIVTSSSELGVKGEKQDEEGEILRW